MLVSSSIIRILSLFVITILTRDFSKFQKQSTLTREDPDFLTCTFYFKMRTRGKSNLHKKKKKEDLNTSKINAKVFCV